MDFKMKYEIKNDYITNRLNRPMIKASGRVFGVSHDTGNKNSTARNNCDYFNRKFRVIGGKNYELSNDKNGQPVPFRVASAHAFIDDTQIIVCVPTDEKAWHVLYDVKTDNEMFDGNANDVGIGLELCFFDSVERTQKAYDKFVWMWAYLANLYQWKDIKKCITFHSVLDPKRKTDPHNAFNIIGKTYDQFLQDVIDEYNECTKEEKKEIVIHGDEDEMKLTDDQWKRLGDSYQGLYEKGLLNDGTWAVKAYSKELTLSEAIYLNAVITARQSKVKV